VLRVMHQILEAQIKDLAHEAVYGALAIAFRQFLDGAEVCCYDAALGVYCQNILGNDLDKSLQRIETYDPAVLVEAQEIGVLDHPPIVGHHLQCKHLRFLLRRAAKQ